MILRNLRGYFDKEKYIKLFNQKVAECNGKNQYAVLEFIPDQIGIYIDKTDDCQKIQSYIRGYFEDPGVYDVGEECSDIMMNFVKEYSW